MGTPELIQDHSEIATLLDEIISQEVAALRQAFDQGAEFAVTRMESPRHRMLHRLECSSVERYLDRHSQWSAHHRSRLVADREHRLALPALVTRDAARHLTGVRSCKVCWPNAHGTDPRPLRKVNARGLRPHHLGHVLSTGDGQPLGTIVSLSIQTTRGEDGRASETVEVVTSERAFEFSPAEHVFIWDLPTDGEALRRKMGLFHRLGTGLTPAH